MLWDTKNVYITQNEWENLGKAQNKYCARSYNISEVTEIRK